MQTESRRFLILALGVALAGCASAPPRLEYRAIQSRVMREAKEYAVYQPLDRKPGERLPLVIFLHGGGDSPDCFDQAGIGEHLDFALAKGTIPRVVIALPQGDLGFWENWADGSQRYRDWVLDELVPTVEKKYGTLPCPTGCHVMGISMGGYGAMRFALLEPERFASVTALSAPIFDTNQMLEFRNSFWWGVILPVESIWGPPDRKRVRQDDLYLRWTRQEDLRGMRLLLAWGDHDKPDIIAANQRFHAHLAQHQIRHESQMFSGGHDWESWKPVIERALSLQVTPSTNRR